MRQHMHNIITISSKVGYPKILVTLTCKPERSETKNALILVQIFTNLPDLAASVFRVELRLLMAFLIDEKFFGGVVAYIKVIKFQNRVVPHVHCLFFVTLQQKTAHIQLLFTDFIIFTKLSSLTTSPYR